MARSRFVSGYVAASRAAIVDDLVLAAAIVASARSLPIADERDRSALVQKRGRGKRQRGPHIGAAGGEPIGLRREHADDRVALAADLQRAADDGRVAAEMRTSRTCIPASRPAPRRSRYSSGSSARPICGRMPSTGITSAVASISVAENGGRVVAHTHRSGLDVIQADRFEARRRGLPVLRVEVIHLRRACRNSRPSC